MLSNKLLKLILARQLFDSVVKETEDSNSNSSKAASSMEEKKETKKLSK